MNSPLKAVELIEFALGIVRQSTSNFELYSASVCGSLAKFALIIFCEIQIEIAPNPFICFELAPLINYAGRNAP